MRNSLRTTAGRRVPALAGSIVFALLTSGAAGITTIILDADMWQATTHTTRTSGDERNGNDIYTEAYRSTDPQAEDHLCDWIKQCTPGRLN